MDARVIASEVPLDPSARERLASQGLDYRVVPQESDALRAFAEASRRGFLEGRLEDDAAERVVAAADPSARRVGVFDESAAHPQAPVATTKSWVMDVAVDVQRTLPMWAVSAVTVAATHRRRGVATAMVEGELRAASEAGLAIAGLTVSETMIYGRFGFGIAAFGLEWEVDTRRAGWLGKSGAAAAGARIEFVEREQLADDYRLLQGTQYRRRPGEAAGWAELWPTVAGLAPSKPEPEVRGVRYKSESGETEGVLAYSLKGDDADFTNQILNVRTLVAATSDAYAALWRFALDHDLVGTVRASLRAGDEALPWLVANPRAITEKRRDHHWLRILDVKRCLEARTYRASGSIALVVHDTLGFADGTWTLAIDASGAAVVTEGERGTPTASVDLGASELASLLLGGVSASTLQSAGRIVADKPAFLDQAFAPSAAPVLTFWY